MSVISIKNFSKYYGKKRGVKNINLEVNEKDFFGFIGPNGAGKSTTIRTILGLLKATTGEVLVFGKDINTSSVEILKNVGYLPSETMYYNSMKVSEVIKLSAKLHNIQSDEESKKLCEILDLDVTKKIGELSLGNRKKVGIVCALQHNPPLYILDEPTSGLDPLIKSKFYDLLKERNKQGATIFLSTHVLNEVEKYCKKCAIIKNGEILRVDTIDKLSNIGVKHVEVFGINEINIDNIKNVIVKEDSIEFLYSGNINILLMELTKLNITNVNITDPLLEDVFMHYYNNEEI